MDTEKCFKHILNYFEDDYEKTLTWFYVNNTGLGGVRPIHMVMTGRSKKLLSFIENALDGNVP